MCGVEVGFEISMYRGSDKIRTTGLDASGWLSDGLVHTGDSSILSASLTLHETLVNPTLSFLNLGVHASGSILVGRFTDIVLK